MRNASIACAVAVVLIFASASGSAASEPDTVRGQIVTRDGPLAGAIVRVQDKQIRTISDKNGNFTLDIGSLTLPLRITAAHEGYYNEVAEVAKISEQPTISLRPIPAKDSPGYVWQDPTPDATQKDNCGNCHTALYQQWHADAHSRSAVDPMVMNLYTGTDSSGKVLRGPGYKRDWADEGSCAGCHAPLGAFNHALVEPMTDVHGVEKLGVACDFCHKIQSVSAKGLMPSIGDLELLRPPTLTKLNFGPFDDSIFPSRVPDFSYSPLFKKSALCGSCHEGRFWGVPIYQTYSEWTKSSYAQIGIQCQDCHMRANGELTSFANPKDGGLVRDANEIAGHTMLGNDPVSFLRSAVQMQVSAALNDSLLKVHVRVANVGAGHDLPTGQPMRNMILVVTALDESGNHLPLAAGERIPSWGGSGPEDNDYAGRPGKGYAKVLETLSEYQKALIIDESPEERLADFPAPFWRRTRILSDNRIPPMGADESNYVFIIPGESKHPHVKVLLIYRKAFKPLSDVKNWNLQDLVLAERDLQAVAD